MLASQMQDGQSMDDVVKAFGLLGHVAHDCAVLPVVFQVSHACSEHKHASHVEDSMLHRST